MSERCGIGRRYGCVDAEEPCGPRDSVSAQCNRSAVGPSRRDRGALKRSGRLELVHPAHDMPCASLQFENLQITTPRGDVWPKKPAIGPRALCCCAARPGRAVPKSWLRGPLAALREGRPPPGARSALVWPNSANWTSSGQTGSVCAPSTPSVSPHTSTSSKVGIAFIYAKRSLQLLSDALNCADESRRSDAATEQAVNRRSSRAQAPSLLLANGRKIQ